MPNSSTGPEAARRRAGCTLAQHLNNIAQRLGFAGRADPPFLRRVAQETGIDPVTLRGLERLAPQLRTIETLSAWIEREARQLRTAARDQQVGL